MLHKTESGQVFFNLTDEAVRAPLTRETADTGSALGHGGLELIVGLHSDPDMGTCVAVGIGGVLAELLDKVVLRAVPLEGGAAAEMLAELPFQRLLDGYRGSTPVDRALIGDNRAGRRSRGRIRPRDPSVDLNPVIIPPKGAFIVERSWCHGRWSQIAATREDLGGPVEEKVR